MTGAPDHTLHEDDAGTFTVKVGRNVAGLVAEDHEYPGLWGAWDQDGQLMSRLASREDAAAFLAAWFIAEEQDGL